MKAIVTGATGFLGFELVKLLISKNWNVLALGRNQNKLSKLESLGATTQVIELENFSGLSKQFEQTEILFHCAALSSAWGKSEDFNRINVEGTKQVADWCVKHDVQRIVHISSTSVYFDFSDSFNIKETDVTTDCFANEYSKSKYLSEMVIQAIPEDDMEYTILRPRGIIGDGDPSILPRVIKVMQKGWFPLLREGKALADLTHVKNVAYAAYLAGTKKEAKGEIFNISNDEPISIRTLLCLLQGKMSHKVKLVRVNYALLRFIVKLLEVLSKMFRLNEPVMTPYTIGLLYYSQTLDISKAKKILGYKPHHSIKDAIYSCFPNA